jgi:hypothetical protein
VRQPNLLNICLAQLQKVAEHLMLLLTLLWVCRAFLNPGAGKRRSGISSSPWAAQEGQDFLANHIVPSIDLITTHIWSDNWMG